MTRGTTPLAVAADYADALMTARRAKNLLFLLLLLIILIQAAMFFLARYDVIAVGSDQPAATTQPTASRVDLEKIAPYALTLLNFGGVAFSIILTVVMLLLVTIMLVGRLIGVSSVTSAFIWGVLLVVLLLPWQTLFIPTGDYTVVGASASVGEQPAFKWPGALYTYAELRNHHHDQFSSVWPEQVWYWGRYAGLPALALLVLLIVQVKSSRGLKYALGEADVQVEVTSRQDISTLT